MAVKSENVLCRCNKPIRFFSCMALAVALNAWGEDGADLYPPRFDGGDPRLEIGFKSITWGASSDLNPCGRFCSMSDSAVAQDLSNEAQLYKRGTSLDLGQSGPFSFRFSDKRLKMEVNF